MAQPGTGLRWLWRRPAARKAVIVAVLLDLVFAGLLTVILIGLLVENLFFKWLERTTVLRWGMSAAH